MANNSRQTKRFFPIIIAILMVAYLSTMTAATRTSVQSGNWNSPSTWSPAGNPASGDAIVVANGDTVTITTDATCSNLTIQVGGMLVGDGFAHFLNLGSGSGEDFTINGTFVSLGVTPRLEQDAQWGGSGGLWDFARIDMNGNTLRFTSGSTMSIKLNGAGDPFANYGTFIAPPTVTFNYNGATPQVLSSDANSVYGNLVISNPTGVTLSRALASGNLKGNLQVQVGTLRNGGFAITGNGSNSFELWDNTTFVLTGTSSMVSNFDKKTFSAISTVDYAGANQTVSNELYGNLTLSGTGTKSMPLTSMTVAGNFRMSGTANALAKNSLNIGGGLIVDAGANLDAGALSHTVQGSFVNDGTVTASLSTMTFNGAALQTLSGSTQTTFGNLTVNNPAGIAVSTSANVAGTLQLTNGKLALSNCTLTMAPTGSIIGESTQRYIVTSGTSVLTMRVGNTSAVTFPVGTSTSYNMTSLQTQFGTDNFSVRVIDAISPSCPNNAFAVQRTWEINEQTSGGNGTVSAAFQWRSTEEGTSFNRAAGSLYRFVGEQWSLEGSLNSVSGSDPYVAAVSSISSLGCFIVSNDGALPIQLAHFSAATIQNTNDVMTSWETISETNNYGFFVQRSEGNESNYQDRPNGFVPGHGTTIEPHGYSWVDRNVQSGTYYYRLKQMDLDGTTHFTDGIRVIVSVLASVEEFVPKVFNLAQNYPNPFNPSTRIQFTVDNAGYTTLTVFDVVGKEVGTLYAGIAEPGKAYSVSFDASQVANGTYFYKLVNGNQSSLKKMLLLK